MFFCGEIVILNDDKKQIYRGPSFIRCEQHGCRKMVTNGYIEKYGACSCSGRKFRDAVVLTPEEIEGLKNGDYILNEWEKFFIEQELKGE